MAIANLIRFSDQEDKDMMYLQVEIEGKYKQSETRFSEFVIVA